MLIALTIFIYLPCYLGLKFKLSECPLTWRAADNHCRLTYGGILFSPRSKGEFLEGRQHCQGKRCWIGLHRIEPRSDKIASLAFDHWFAWWDLRAEKQKEEGPCVVLLKTGNVTSQRCCHDHYALCQLKS